MDPPTLTHRDAFTIAGLLIRTTPGSDAFEEVWTDLLAYDDATSTLAVDDSYYGVSANYDPDDESFDYVAGVAVADDASLPSAFDTVAVPEGTYAVFTTSTSAIADTYEAIETEWLPDSAYERRFAPEFEVYPMDYDETDPDVTFEIFVPVADARAPSA